MADERLARSVRAVAQGAAVVVAPVPELDAAFAELSSTFTARFSYATYLNGGAVPPPVVADLSPRRHGSSARHRGAT